MDERKEYYKEWREANKEKRKESDKEYYQANKEQIKERISNYRKANKEQIKELGRKYYEVTKKERSEYNKKYYQATKQERLAYQKKYKEVNTNKEKLRARIRKYTRERRAIDPAYKLLGNLRTRHRKVLKGTLSTTEGLGCDSKFFRDYISAQWTEGMSWDNYGKGKDKWNIDHIIPLDQYYTQPELLPQLIYYSNMQPMWEPENQSKGNKF